jgi:2,4-dichlorophenol 6-monooxygenase
VVSRSARLAARKARPSRRRPGGGQAGARAHNLAWKLAAVLDGSAPPGLLDTYQSERRPVAQYNAEQSLQNAMRLLEVPRALGFSDDPEAARRNFAATLGDQNRRREVAAAIAHQAEHFDMLGLQLGFSYEAGALTPDGSEKAVVANPVREFLPSSRPGARLPHGWLSDRTGRRSTLDLIRLDRLTLLVGPDGRAWLEAARMIHPWLECRRMGIDREDRNDWWTTVAGMQADGALLVRPDQHIAFRARGAVTDAVAVLQGAVAAALCRDPLASRRATGGSRS